ncbi:MAG: XRE family transcriptional regulator [Gemmatimonadota bacterium]
MPKTRSYEELRARLPADVRTRAEAEARRILADMRLADLRAALEVTQKEIARRLHKSQSAVSQIENRADMYVSTLREYVRAMGGELEILATFPDATVRLDQFRRAR